MSSLYKDFGCNEDEIRSHPRVSGKGQTDRICSIREGESQE